jgi:Skp family chaperone for outer membrane proteins
MKHPSILIILLSLLTVATVQAAQVYKWVDENGQTQFSQFPPAEANQAKKIKVESAQSASPSKSNTKLKDVRQKLLEDSVARNTQSEQDKEDEKDAERKAKNCELAKQQLRDLEANGRVYKTLENGEREWYDVKGRDKLISDAKKQVSEHCSK